MKYASAALVLILFTQQVGITQTPAGRSVLGTVSSFDKDGKALEVKPENTAPFAVKLLTNTVVQRIAPGETDLKNAAAIAPNEVNVGDRVLVTLASNGTDVLRL